MVKEKIESRWCLCLCLSCVMSIANTSVYAERSIRQINQSEQQGDLRAFKSVPSNAMAEAAHLVGVKRCLQMVTQISKLSLIGSLEHDVVIDWDRNRADESAFFGLMGIVQPMTGVQASKIAVIPSNVGGCTVMVEHMAWAPKSCRQLAQDELPQYTASPLVSGMVVLTSFADKGSTVSLMDAGPGCMILRRYVKYRWTPDDSSSVKPLIDERVSDAKGTS